MPSCVPLATPHRPLRAQLTQPFQSNLQPLSARTVTTRKGTFPSVLISGSLETLLLWQPGDNGEFLPTTMIQVTPQTLVCAIQRPAPLLSSWVTLRNLLNSHNLLVYEKMATQLSQYEQSLEPGFLSSNPSSTTCKPCDLRQINS